MSYFNLRFWFQLFLLMSHGIRVAGTEISEHVLIYQYFRKTPFDYGGLAVASLFRWAVQSQPFVDNYPI